MTSSQYGPYAWGYTRVTMARTKRCNSAKGSQSHKPRLSSDRRLQLAYVKPESLVMADQLRRREYVPWPCTHRPSSDGSWGHPKSVYEPARDGTAEGELGDWR